MTAALLMLVMALPASGWAQSDDCSPRALKKLKRMHKASLSDFFETGEFDMAQRTLKKAIVFAREEGCDATLEYAQILLDLGIFYFTDPNNPDKDQGRLMFKKAVKVNACVRINPDLSDPHIEKELKKIKRRLGRKCTGTSSEETDSSRKSEEGSSSAVQVVQEDVDEGPAPKKLEHEVPDEAPQLSPLVLKVRVPNKAGRYKVKKVILYYRRAGQSDYTALPFRHVDGYLWKVKVPASDVKGSVFQYYITVMGPGSKLLYANGNSGSPNIVSLTEPVKKPQAEEDECDDPLHPEKCKDNEKSEKKESSDSDEDESSDEPSILFSLGGRIGAGFLTESMCSTSAVPADSECGDMGRHPNTPGFAMGEYGVNLMVGYFMNENFVLGLEGKLGMLKSDFVTEGSPWAIGGSGYLNMSWFTGEMKDVFRGFFGFMLGGGMLFHSLTFDPEGKADTFMHGWIILGPTMGISVGSEHARFYGKMDALLIFPENTTFHIDVSFGGMFTF